MKRDMDLIRKILLAAEALPHAGSFQSLDGVDEDSFVAHALWLKEAGLIDAVGQVGGGSLANFAIVSRLTWNGTEFVAAMQDDTLWSKAKEKFMKPGMSFTLDIVKGWLVEMIAKGS
jgi:sugar/nucleoside kinase (ribokinase family)